MQQEWQKEKFLNFEMNRKLVLLSGLISFFLSFGGCSYKLGYPGTSDGYLYLIVRNDSLAPQLGPLVEQQVRKNLVNSKNFTVTNSREKADFILEIILKSYDTSPESFRSDDTLFASVFGMSVQADVEISSNDNSLKYRETVKGSASVARSEVERLPVKDQSLHSLAEDLANQVILSLLSAGL